MCKSCEEVSDNLRVSCAREHNLYPARAYRCQVGVHGSSLIRSFHHTLSLPLPTVKMLKLPLLLPTFSTLSTGLINTITK